MLNSEFCKHWTLNVEQFSSWLKAMIGWSGTNLLFIFTSPLNLSLDKTFCRENTKLCYRGFVTRLVSWLVGRLGKVTALWGVWYANILLRKTGFSLLRFYFILTASLAETILSHKHARGVFLESRVYPVHGCPIFWLGLGSVQVLYKHVWGGGGSDQKCLFCLWG